MASLNDVHAQLITVNATLSTIGANINAGTTATNGVKTAVNQLDTDLKAGFNSTIAVLKQAVDRLTMLVQIDIESAKLLHHLTKQTDTMICALEHISENTCAIHSEAVIQSRLQTEMRDDVDGLLSIASAAYPAAALERDRLAELQAEIQRCCPPEVPPPACTYRPCAKPKAVGEPKLPQLPPPDKHDQPPR
jgi:hypothetical protein